MKMLNSTLEDIPGILELYRLATDYQKLKFEVHWPVFETALIQQEITQGRQWKLIIDEQMACIWSTSFSDPEIWIERNKDPAVYIHRIATHPAYRGRNLVNEIVKWARLYAVQYNKKFIRMDTVGNNSRLISYYQKCGFEFLGLFKLHATNRLPEHYHKAPVCLFQIEL